MDRKKSNWGSTRSKLTQDGYMYRMKLGNPPTGSNAQPEQRHQSSPTSSSNLQRVSTTQSRPAKSTSTTTLDADSSAVELRTISGLLAQLNLGRAFRGDHDLDPNSAMEFLYRCYAPFVIHRRHKSLSFELGNFIDAGMLKDSMLAKALVVWTSDMQTKFTPSSGKAREFLLSQRNTVLRELRTRISTPEACTSDSVTWTILLLVATELIHDNIDAMATHLGALRHIIHLRGGVDSPALSKWVKTLLSQFEGFLNYRQFHDIKGASPRDTPPGAERFSYPFPPQHPDQLARMPWGFTELFRTMPVTRQVFGLVESISQWAKLLSETTAEGKRPERLQSTASAMTLDSYRAFDLLQQDKIGTTERLLVLGLFSYCIYMNDQVLYSVMESGLRLHCMAQVTKNMEPIEQGVHDSMLWVAAVLMATGGDGSPLHALGRRIYRTCRGTLSSPSSITQTSERYFWHRNLTQRLTVPGVERARADTIGNMV
ncbi:hypothetical protein H2200_000287 [Cladophialophora chaetospira]|uniref:Uncharacterized protein n=1 Tax=Cladophialophora chaetospira TaxID=386627 RepID=A0AA39CQT0_9EURO|nr:hypothetical protein H2200_000287 [Cladophialophora chaetospira]